MRAAVPLIVEAIVWLSLRERLSRGRLRGVRVIGAAVSEGTSSHAQQQAEGEQDGHYLSHHHPPFHVHCPTIEASIIIQDSFGPVNRILGPAAS